MATLAELKRNLRLSEDDNDFDEELSKNLEAARSHIASVDVDLSEPIAPALSQAIILLAGYWFDNTGGRMDEPQRPTAYGVDRLIAPFRSVSL